MRAGQSSSWMGATDEREGLTDYDLRGAVSEGFGEPSPAIFLAGRS